MRVCVLGRTQALLDTITVLLSSGHEIGLVATCRPSPEYAADEGDFRAVAEELRVPFLVTQDINLQENVDYLQAAACDVAISMNWVSLVGVQVCNLFPFGVLNIHAGDLPRYRGNAPVAWAIIAGEEHVGVCVHFMEPDSLDSGPILVQRRIALPAEAYVGDVLSEVRELVPAMFLEALNDLEMGTAHPLEQPLEGPNVLRCYPRHPEDGAVRWSESAVSIARLVRASAEPFSGSFCKHDRELVVVWRARHENWRVPSLATPGQIVARDTDNGEVRVATGDGVLVLEEIEIPSLGRGSPADLLPSLRTRLRDGDIGCLSND